MHHSGAFVERRQTGRKISRETFLGRHLFQTSGKFSKSLGPTGSGVGHDRYDRCAVFEGFMDFLSYLQYAREHPGLPPMNFCILNSTAMAGRSGEFLSRHRLVHAFLDNDKAGMDALEKLEGNLGKDTVLVNESVRLYPRHNDFNEFLQACKKKAMTAGNEM